MGTLNAVAVASIRAAMVADGVTQKELALALGVSTDTVGRLLSGESDITLTRLEGIADVLKRTPGDLLRIDGSSVRVDVSGIVASCVDVTVKTGA